MCTDGQPRMSCVHERPVCADGHTRTATDVLCVLTNTHRRPVCADGHPRTSSTDVLCVLADTHGRPIQPTWDKITQTVHGKGQRAESKDQRADMCTEGQPLTSYIATDVMCVLTDTDGHTRTATDVLCVLADIHGRPVCAGGHPRTSCKTRSWSLDPTGYECLL
ncbi:unnamed protein product, partial [Brassica rapa]